MTPTLFEQVDQTIYSDTNSRTIFLCQTFDFQHVSSIPRRSVFVPKDWNIFLPILNWVYAMEDKEENEKDGLLNLARERMDDAANIKFLINGRPAIINLSAFRTQPVVTEVLLPKDNVFDIRPGLTTIITDGFWILFRPLVNVLTLETFGSCRLGITRIEVNYRIFVT